jgi:hypothetical protein
VTLHVRNKEGFKLVKYVTLYLGTMESEYFIEPIYISSLEAVAMCRETFRCSVGPGELQDFAASMTLLWEGLEGDLRLHTVPIVRYGTC